MDGSRGTTVEDFLNEISLHTDYDTYGGETVTIMTIHASKGLEFEHVYVIGPGGGLLPSIGEMADMRRRDGKKNGVPELLLGYWNLGRLKG